MFLEPLHFWADIATRFYVLEGIMLLLVVNIINLAYATRQLKCLLLYI